MHRARIEETDTGLQAADDGWFILNLAEMSWATVEGGGTWTVFEAPSAPSKELGIGVHILPPGETPGMYHAENLQEGFLVLSGECLAVIEGEEHRLRAWDYFHCPAGTAHITIGAGSAEAPCAILMVGRRSPDEATRYIPDPVARRHGAAVDRETDDPRVAYRDRPPIRRVRSPWPPAEGGG
jgi:uncharacterized cupin superfamily protein